MRILTWNVHKGKKNAANAQAALDLLLKYGDGIAKTEPVIVCVQEAGDLTVSSDLDEHAPSGKSKVRVFSGGGLKLKESSEAKADGSGRMIILQLETPAGTKLNFFGVHIKSLKELEQPEDRGGFAALLRREVDSEVESCGGGPVVVAGDFNSDMRRAFHLESRWGFYALTGRSRAVQRQLKCFGRSSPPLFWVEPNELGCPPGTYYYESSSNVGWHMFDGLAVSEELHSLASAIIVTNLLSMPLQVGSISKPDGDISDHLPVECVLNIA